MSTSDPNIVLRLRLPVVYEWISSTGWCTVPVIMTGADDHHRPMGRETCQVHWGDQHLAQKVELAVPYDRGGGEQRGARCTALPWPRCPGTERCQQQPPAKLVVSCDRPAPATNRGSRGWTIEVTIAGRRRSG